MSLRAQSRIGIKAYMDVIYRNPQALVTPELFRQMAILMEREKQGGILGLPKDIGRKVDAPILAATTGVFQPIYGRAVIDWMTNQQHSTVAVLPKLAWTKSGWRVKTANPSTLASGIAETGAFPDAVKSTWAEVSTDPKYLITHWQASEKANFSARVNDGIDLEALDRMDFAPMHAKGLNGMLHVDGTTVAGNNLESIDRVTASKSGVDGGLYDANDVDIYGLDRDGVTTYDAQLLHNSGTDRDLTRALLNQLIRQCRQKDPIGNFVLITGWDTYDVMGELESAKLRFPEGNFALTLENGLVRVSSGHRGGFKLSMWDGIPIVIDEDTGVDTISRIYCLDLKHIGLKLALPTMYLRTDRAQWMLVDKMYNYHAFVTGAELVADRFNCHGQLRDLK